MAMVVLPALGLFLDYSTRTSGAAKAPVQIHAEVIRSLEVRQSERIRMEAEYDGELDAQNTRMDRTTGILIGRL